MSQLQRNVKIEASMQGMGLQPLEQLFCCCSSSRTANIECSSRMFAKGLPLFLDGEICQSSPAARVGARKSEQEREDEERSTKHVTKLKSVVATFVRKAIVGFSVRLVDPETLTVKPAFFLMDRRLTVFSLKARGEMVPKSSPVQDYDIKDVISLYKGRDVAARTPSLASISKLCVGMDIVSKYTRIFFLFDEAIDKDDFFLNFKILRLSMETPQVR